jgi:hypothetical protein
VTRAGPHPLALAALTLALLAAPAVHGADTASRGNLPRKPPPRTGSTVAGPAAPARAPAQPRIAPHAPAPRPPSSRVADATHAGALFVPRSWVVAKPPPPPPPEPPPPEPTAPPFPFTYVGSYAPGSEPPVYFLARGDRVVEAHVGDKLDGVYSFESAAGGQLVFVYLPLDTRSTLAAGVPR